MSSCSYEDNYDKNVILLIIIMFLAIIIVYYTDNNRIKIACLFIITICIICLIINYQGGYIQYMQSQEDIDKILYFKEKLKDVIPDHIKDTPIISYDKESYTWKKCKIFLCMKDFDDNTIINVLLHEYAHVLTPFGEPAHGEVFKKNFTELLEKAIALKLYDPIKGIDENYLKVCGNGK